MFRGQKKRIDLKLQSIAQILYEGLITSITMVHHWIADQLPMLGCLLV